MKITGVVLSGGQSRRMGADKGLLKTENKSWVKIAVDKLRVVCENVVVSVNPAQTAYYSEFPSSMLVEDQKSIRVNGPLHGLLSVHTIYPGADLFVLACDMVAMHSMVLEELLEIYKSKPGFEVYVYNNDDGYQPVAGIYTSALLSEILLQSRMGILSKFSLKHVLENSRTCLIPVSDQWNQYFVNYNYREDIDFQ
jgi:molybdopterin-guanine dinucleotide biosynthesis protein A